MEIKKIQELVRLVSKHQIQEIEIEDKDGKIKIKNGCDTFVLPPSNFPTQQASYANPAIPTAHASEKAQDKATESEEKTNELKSNQQYIVSPMIGTFYAAADPNKPDFVKVGDDVQKGQVLCIVEAMKLFNEIESEYTGKIVKILVENASPVEFNQPLFVIETK